MDKIIIYVVFGLSALLVPVWFVLDWRKKAAERARLNEEMFKKQLENKEEDYDE